MNNAALSYIPELIQDEIDRLLRIREILMELLPVESADALVQRSAESTDAEPATAVGEVPVPVIKLRASRRGLRSRRVGRAPKQKAEEPRALARYVPAGPVVVSASALAHERETKTAHAHPAPQHETAPVNSGSLASLIHDVVARTSSSVARDAARLLDLETNAALAS